MDQENYEQISINKEKILTDTLPYLKDGINVSLELKDDLGHNPFLVSLLNKAIFLKGILLLPPLAGITTIFVGSSNIELVLLNNIHHLEI